MHIGTQGKSNVGILVWDLATIEPGNAHSRNDAREKASVWVKAGGRDTPNCCYTDKQLLQLYLSR